MIKLLIADDHSLIRQGLKSIVSAESDIEVIAEAANFHELRVALSEIKVDLLILDISMPKGNALDFLKETKTLYPRLPILVLSVHPEDQYALRALKSGASGYLSKECAPEQLVTAIRQILGGQHYFTSKVRELLANAVKNNGGDSRCHSDLSDREFQVLIRIGKGISLTDIAKDLSLSVKTIGTYRERILNKMHLNNNAEIIQYLVENNLISPQL